MQFRKFFILPFILCLLSPLTAQQVTTDATGRQIVTYPDGSWRYFDPADPADQKLAAGQEARRKDSLQLDILQRTQFAMLDAMEAEKEARLQKALLEEQLQEEVRQKDGGEPALIARLQEELSTAQQKLKAREEEKKKWEKYLDYAQELVEAKDEKDLLKWREKLAPSGLLLETSSGEQTAEEVAFTFEPPSKPASFDPTLELSDFPPAIPCRTRLAPFDEMTGSRPLRHAPQVLFKHTNERLRPVLKTEDFITGRGYLTRLGKDVYVFTLDITIASQYAQKEFGMLEKESPLLLQMVSGLRLPLLNAATSTGRLNPVEKTVTYTGRYPLTKNDLKVLRESEIDQIRLIWSTGYEDYTVYDLDFFSRQLNCLEDP